MRDDHVFVFGVSACDGDDRTLDHSRGTRMACCRLWIVVSSSLTIRPINTVPATRTPQNDSDGNALEFLGTSVVRIDRIIFKMTTLTYQESMQPKYLTSKCCSFLQKRLGYFGHQTLIFFLFQDFRQIIFDVGIFFCCCTHSLELTPW